MYILNLFLLLHIVLYVKKKNTNYTLIYITQTLLIALFSHIKYRMLIHLYINRNMNLRITVLFNVYTVIVYKIIC